MTLRFEPDPPRFGAPATATMDVAGPGVKVSLGGKNVLVAVEGQVRVGARITASMPDPPKPHAWKCTRCQRDFTLDPAPCAPGRAPIGHDWECQVSWKNYRLETVYCHSGLTAAPAAHVHDFKCKRGECGHRRLADVVDPSSDGWLDLARAAVCIAGELPRAHEWKCNRCGDAFSEAVRDVACRDAPGSPPEIVASFSATASLSADLEVLAKRLFLKLTPHELVMWTPQLADLVAAAHHDSLAEMIDALKRKFPVEAPARDGFDRACRPALDKVLTAFHDSARPALAGLRDALADFARRELDAMNELFERCVALLALIGDRRAVLDLATRLVTDGLRAGRLQPHAYWKLAGHLMSVASDTLPAMAQTITARVVLATRDVFAQHRTHVESFLEDQLARVAATGHDVLAWSRGVVAAVRDGVDVHDAAAFLVGVAVALVPGTLAPLRSDYPSVLGSLFGAVAAAAEDDLGTVFGPLVDQLATTHRLTCEEAKLFLSHLGGDVLFQKAVRWIRDNWARFAALVRQGADELRRWLDYILGLVEQAQHPFAFPEHERLVALLKWLQGLPAALLSPEQFGDVVSSFANAGQTLRRGIGAWIADEAAKAQTTKAHFVRELVTQSNPFMKNLRRAHAAMAPILGEAEHVSAEGVERMLRAVADLQEADRRVWNVLFAGGAGEGPLTAQVNVHGLATDPLQASGASISISEPTAFSDALAGGEAVIGGLAAAAAPDASFVAFDVQRTKFRVPHPSMTSPIELSAGSTLPPIPLSVPVPWTAGVAVCHLPEFHVIDMRYHFPYGDVACYHVADLDDDGFVRDWEVRKVREAVIRATSEDFYDFALDCDGDGQITEHDLQLAIEQQSSYINGLMYRRATAPVGYFVALTPTVWAFVACTDLTDESIPRGLTRRGVLWVADGQLAIPLPPAFKDGRNYYPVRFHYENRCCIDKFDSLAPAPPGTTPLIAPLTATERWDMVLRGGKTGRDWQVYFTTEPVNPVLLTWNLMGTLYLRGVASAGAGIGGGGAVSAGVGAKGASYIHFAYETTAPLVEVIEEWSDRLRDVAESRPSDLPVPWAFMKQILEWTDVPRLSRALIQIAGPIIDLLFDWCDDGHHIRGALGYIRQYVLNRCEPAPTWEQLRAEIAEWIDVPPAERTAILDAVVRTQGTAAAEDPVYVPWDLARACREVSASPRIRTAFEDARGRFAASLDQLVPAGDDDAPYASTVDIPSCGSFKVLNPFIAAFPVRWQDLQDNAHPSEATLDQILAVRGNPFYKPIYHTLVELGPEAKLYTCPDRDLNYFIGSVANQKAIVEGSRVLEDAAGNRWLWVRTEAWQHGWLFVDAVVCKDLFSVKEAAEIAGKQAAQDMTAQLLQEVLGQAAAAGIPVDALGPDAVDKINRGLGDLVDKLAKKGARPTVTKIEASPPSTVDESRYARVCRQMLARRAAGRSAPGDDHIYRCYTDALTEFELRMLGASPEHADLKTRGDTLADAFNRLSLAKREKMWAAGTAWLKILEYGPLIIQVFVDALVPPALEGDFDRAWNAFLEMLRKTRDVELEELLLAAQMIAPAVKEVILTMIDIGIKLKSVKDAVATGEMNIAGAGEVGAAGDPGQVTWKDVGTKLVRLMIDDEEEPGRPATTKKAEARGLRKNHDHAIAFSFEVTAKVEQDNATEDPDAARRRRGEHLIALADPYIVRIEQRDAEPVAPEHDAEGGESEAGDDIPDGLSDEDQSGEEGGATPPGDETEAADDDGLPGTAAPGKAIELVVTEWGALVWSDPPTGALVASSRVPQAFKDTVGWQYAVVAGDGSAGEWHTIDARGEHIRFVVPPEHDGKQLRFRTFTQKFDWSQIASGGQT